MSQVSPSNLLIVILRILTATAPPFLDARTACVYGIKAIFDRFA